MSKYFIAVTILSFSFLFCNAQNDTSSKPWSVHYQFTAVTQTHPSFKAKYSGENSISDSAEKGLLTITSTLYVGRKLWKNAAFYINPEISGGEGFSEATGIAGFTNGESFRIGDPKPKLYLARAYLQQHFALGDKYISQEDDANKVGTPIPESRITISAGKFALSDFFDDNNYSHDPRTQFLNWSLMGNGAWDYPANTRGYTVGFVAELIKPSYAVRISAVQIPKLANGPELDSKVFKVHGLTLEAEKSFNINQHSGMVRLLAFRNTTHAPSYNKTLQAAATGDSTNVPVFTGDISYRNNTGIKYGFNLNAEQELSNAIGVFARAGWNDGKTATWAYTEIDHSFSVGLSIKGNAWKRPNDNFGAAFVSNGISKDHRSFLKAGLYGFIIGDGNLSYGYESIAEAYYQANLFEHVYLAADYQFVNNPAYNKDRGPVHVFSVRAHVEF